MPTIAERVDAQSQIGIRIETARYDAGLTQKRLGELIGTSDQTISSWESGINSPKCDKFVNLCRVLNVSADELLGIK